jgi:hypothetical protein
MFPAIPADRRRETQLDVVSVKPVDPGADGGNGGSYYFCDGVALP